MVLPILAAGIALAAVPLSAATNEDLFAQRLRPVLEQHCAGCHTGAAPQGGLSVASLDTLLHGGKRGPAIRPGDAGASLLMRFVRGEQQPVMPLGGALKPEVIEALAEAIGQMTPPAAATAAPDRDAWLYRKPAAPAIPEVKNREWVRNPIDAFVLAALEAKKMRTAAPADRRALIRRVYFDLIGLPPPPGEVEEFVSSADPEAYEKLIDKLLADQRYGERWARHWLDLVRFAESDGFAIDGERPAAWRYRDYVIRAFNDDKPYDEFVKDQLAGDEIGRSPGSMVALGFLRMGTWEADANFKTQLRQDFLNEITSTTSSVFLGLTAGCARCHDHKYDPIPTRDFYRLQAFFAATRIDERPAAFLEVEKPAEMRRLLRRYEDEADEAEAGVKRIEQDLKDHYIAAKGLKPDDKAADDFRKSLRDKKDATFSAEQRKAHEEATLRQRRTSEAARRYRPVAYAVADVAPPHVPSLPDTYVLGGGELAAKGDKVEPGFPVCVTGKEEPAVIPFAGGSSGRRRGLAEWIASPSNPLTARVMANRIWQHHFGEGIVRTPSDFGRNGDKPSHPELLDWLALEFVEKKWSVKAMHRLMLTSNAYRQSTSHPDWKQYAAADPENRLLWRMNWLRLESEVIRDSILALSGRLTHLGGGPGFFFDISDDVAQGFEFFKWFPSADAEQRRRSVYAFQRRSVMMPMMEVFDGANMSESCSRRNVTTVAPQALTLLNGELTMREARHFAERVIELAGPEPARQVDRAFLLALARPPDSAEKREALALYDGEPPAAALARLGAVLFNLNEFAYLE
jgi:mono/diheme cytochrome c family protein